VLTFTPVPEPGAVLFTAAACAGGWWCRRRRSARSERSGS
jgi:hypothetical protein